MEDYVLEQLRNSFVCFHKTYEWSGTNINVYDCLPNLYGSPGSLRRLNAGDIYGYADVTYSVPSIGASAVGISVALPAGSPSGDQAHPMVSPSGTVSTSSSFPAPPARGIRFLDMRLASRGGLVMNPETERFWGVYTSTDPWDPQYATQPSQVNVFHALNSQLETVRSGYFENQIQPVANYVTVTGFGTAPGNWNELYCAPDEVMIGIAYSRMSITWPTSVPFQMGNLAAICSQVDIDTESNHSRGFVQAPSVLSTGFQATPSWNQAGRVAWNRYRQTRRALAVSSGTLALEQNWTICPPRHAVYRVRGRLSDTGSVSYLFDMGCRRATSAWSWLPDIDVDIFGSGSFAVGAPLQATTCPGGFVSAGLRLRTGWMIGRAEMVCRGL
jgi:hypothetical protein